ncbi:MAG: hypothetical protein ACR2HH_13610 [Chthoniobacterales bacterium]
MKLKNEANGWSFDATLALEEYELPGDALVAIEAYRQTSWMRFDFGTVTAITPPADRLLTEFDSPEDILFRVRVTSRGTPEEPHGLLVAEADRVRLLSREEVDDPRIPLLPVLPADLGPELWRIDFVDYPRLQLNSAAGNYKQIGLDPGFVAVVYPAALREVLGRILHREDYRDIDEPNDWQAAWLRFAAQVLEVGEPPAENDGDDADDNWIDAAVAAFARKHALLDKFKTFWNEEGR